MKDLNLAQRWAKLRPVRLPPRSKHGRWAEWRHIFQYDEPRIYAAKHAIWEVLDYGTRSRKRWEDEYRHQRRLMAITRGDHHKDEYR